MQSRIHFAFCPFPGEDSRKRDGKEVVDVKSNRMEWNQLSKTIEQGRNDKNCNVQGRMNNGEER